MTELHSRQESQLAGADPGRLWRFACPACRADLEPLDSGEQRCPADGTTYRRIDGIWRFLPPERTSYFARFLDEYETVRRAEGRGSGDPAYYQALPFEDRSGRFGSDWRIRARSFQTLLERVVLPLEQARRRPLAILDLGAGSGWLSNRLSHRGHDVAAVDLSTSTSDGLGAHVWYAPRDDADAGAIATAVPFTPLQAEFDRLPFGSSQFDLLVFNGSLHYSVDYAATLREASRVLRDGGRLVVMDSPVYRDAASGWQMVRERETEFERAYGFPSNALPNENFLTFERLTALAAQLGLAWQILRPWYGLGWALRPWRARLRGHREPAQFLVLVGRRLAGRRMTDDGGQGADDGRRTINQDQPGSSIVHPAVPPSRYPAIPTSPRQPVRPPSRLTVRHRAIVRRLLWWRVRLVDRRRHGRLVLEQVDGMPILVLPQVFNPKLFRTGAIFVAAFTGRLIPPGSAVLDLGTGSGVGAIAATRWAERVVAVDVSPEAVRCARLNVLLNRVEDRVDVREGDLFAPVAGERFDVVLFNPPYFRGSPRDLLDRAWRSNDAVERFAAGLDAHLTDRGHALVILSSDGDSETFLRAFRECGFDVGAELRRDLINEVVTVYRLSRGPALSDDRSEDAPC